MESGTRWREGGRQRPSGAEGGISIDSEVLCAGAEALTDSVALLFSVPGVSRRFVEAF